MKLCHLCRTLGSLWLDEPQRWPAFIEKHVRHCPACREHLARESSLAQGLQTAAATERQPLPRWLPSRLESRLRTAEAVDEPRSAQPAVWHRIAWAGAGVAGVLLVWVAFSFWAEPPARPGTAVTANTVPDPAVLVQTLVPRGGESFEQWSQLLERSLTREINSALQDSRGALIALVQNFVPEPSIAAVTERANGLFPDLATSETVRP